MEFIVERERIYKMDDQGHLLAEITFPEVREGVFNINHTFVDESLRGQGVAGQLMEAAVSQIHSLNGQIEATCSYALKWLDKHQMK
ncbi:MAG: GNAT family N-acetyltransferase [Eggerthia catenaformis]|uniref:GNAT family N-acetyltransferase n=1 Tax=Eggerthia catenaformis TaxID=31973 RepID=UPI003F9FDEBE